MFGYDTVYNLDFLKSTWFFQSLDANQNVDSKMVLMKHLML